MTCSNESDSSFLAFTRLHAIMTLLSIESKIFFLDELIKLSPIYNDDAQKVGYKDLVIRHNHVKHHMFFFYKNINIHSFKLM